MSRKPSQPGPRYGALIQLLRTAESLWEASRVFFARWDLSPSQFNVLNVLHGQPQGCTQTQLGRDLIMHRSNITGLLDRLAERGLVERRADPADRRAHLVFLTEQGRELVREILPTYYALAEEVWSGLSAERTERLLSDLRRVCAEAERINQVSSTPSVA
jgi:MarR family transcriptional regulator, 2-MHQ and catechol-resistance regulon repressor